MVPYKLFLRLQVNVADAFNPGTHNYICYEASRSGRGANVWIEMWASL